MNRAFLLLISLFFSTLFFLSLIVAPSIFGTSLKIRDVSDDLEYTEIYRNSSDFQLDNPYSIIVQNLENRSEDIIQASNSLIRWLISPSFQEKIVDYKINGTSVFFPGNPLSEEQEIHQLSEEDYRFWEEIPLVTQISVKLRLGVTTTLRDSGLLDHLLSELEKFVTVDLSVLALGTGQILQAGRDGEVDVLIVHDELQEKQYIEDGYGLHRLHFMSSKFILVGKRSLEFDNIDSVSECFRIIYNSNFLFISRGDTSGTHNRELAIWKSANLTISSDNREWKNINSWYSESGQGMSATLRIAKEFGAYTLIDEGTWLFIQNSEI